MNQGAKRSAFAERGHDLYETPLCAISTLMRIESLPHRIWEPAAGRGALSRELKKAGHEVIASDLMAYEGADVDITPSVNFFDEITIQADTVVTNPPFKDADRFIRLGLRRGVKMIVLLRLMA